MLYTRLFRQDNTYEENSVNASVKKSEFLKMLNC